MGRLTILAALLATFWITATACTSTAAPTPTSTPKLDAYPGTPQAQPNDSYPRVSAGAFLPDVASVVEEVMPAVVQVLASVEQPNIFGQSAQTTSQGSGVFFDNAGHLLTNNHVVENAIEVEVVLSNRQRLPAAIVGTDPDTDLAVLKVDPQKVDGLVIAPLGDTDSMRIGDWVIAIGSPLGFEGSVTVGVVSAKRRSLDLGNNTRLDDLLQTDAVINPGNSGGPLLNLNGEVIGINTAIIRGQLASGQQADGIGFAISTGTAAPVSRQLIENGRVVRPRIGVMIQDVNPATAAERGLAVDQGVLIIAIAPDGPADQAGIKVDDVIVQVDDFPVSNTTELVRLFLTDYSLGDTARITIVRSAVHLTFDLVLAEVN